MSGSEVLCDMIGEAYKAISRAAGDLLPAGEKCSEFLENALEMCFEIQRNYSVGDLFTLQA